jgi:hypothetical protein
MGDMEGDRRSCLVRRLRASWAPRFTSVQVAGRINAPPSRCLTCIDRDMSSTSDFSFTLSHLGVSSIPITAVWTFSGLCVTAALLVAYLDYAAWYALGPGGPPHSVKGWMSVHRVGLLRKSNVLDISVFDTLIKCRPEEGQSYLTLSTTPPLAHVKSNSTFDELPTRRGPRPQISRWVAPIRQLSETANDELKAVGFVTTSSVMRN